MPPRLNIAVRRLFATPVAAVEVPEAARWNSELRVAILARREAVATIQASNAGGWHSGRDLPEWGGPVVGELLDMARAIASQMTTDRRGQPASVAWRATAWANVNGPGAGNIAHYHPGSVWSGTYYVDDGGIAEDPSLGGEFEMLDPRGAAPAMFAPTLALAGEGGLSVGATESIRPKAGVLILFPSWLFHQVRLYRGTRERISVAFNLAAA